MNVHTFAPARDHILALALMSLIALIGIGWAPMKLGWLFIFPALGLWWVLRAKTVVAAEGIAIRYAFRKSVVIPWQEFAGLGFKGSRAFAQTTAGKRHSLPGVTFNSLPELADASAGRIPDALSAGKAAADAKVRIVHRDGQEVLLTQEEYAAYKAAHPQAEDGQS